MVQHNTLKTALLDASSAIILCKSDLHIAVVEMYNVVMPGSVYQEITGNSYPCAEEYRQLLLDKKITIKDPIPDIENNSDKQGFHNLGQGEHDAIQLYYVGQGDFVVTDDGVAAKYCKREQIPFINALLVPVILAFAGMQGDDYCRKARERIIDISRYSPWVIDFAEGCEREELLNFIPQ